MSHKWPTSSLAELLLPAEEQIDIQPDQLYKQITVRMWGKGVILRGEVTGGEIAATRSNIARAGQLIISRIDARHGALGLVPQTLDGAIVTNDFPLFEVNQAKLLPRFLEWISKTHSFVELCRRASEGTTNRVRLKVDRLLNSPFRLPPLDEQRRIVAHIDTLAARITEARGLRQQAVGEAEALLNRATSKVLDSFPSHVYKSIISICDVKGGIQKSGDRTPTHNPRRYLTVAHVQRNQIDIGDPRYFEVSDNELERWRLVSGDVLVVEGNGSADQIGRAALFKGEIENCVHQNHIIRVRPDQTQLQSEFLNHYLNSSLGKTAMQEISRTSSGLFHLSVGKIQSLILPIPSLEEQGRIVAYLDDLHTRIDALKRLQAETGAEMDALLPTVLDRAFHLTPSPLRRGRRLTRSRLGLASPLQVGEGLG